MPGIGVYPASLPVLVFEAAPPPAQAVSACAGICPRAPHSGSADATAGCQPLLPCVPHPYSCSLKRKQPLAFHCLTPSSAPKSPG